MKFIKRTKLAFKDDVSDKLYEVDLCEQLNDSEQRFLVNFRYGRRGANLREGTKTATAVDYQQAEDIFNSLVVSKTNKGYVDCAASKQTAKRDSAQPFELNSFLTQISDEKNSKRRARLIWLLPPQTNPELATWLSNDLDKGDEIEIYSRLWAIGRTGNSHHVRFVSPFIDSNSDRLKKLAQEVLLQLTGTADRSLTSLILSEVPATLATAINSDDASAISQQLSECLADKKLDKNGLIKSLYIVAKYQPMLHRALIDVIRRQPFEPGVFQGIRYLFKMSEFRLDREMFGMLNHRLETAGAFFHYEWNWCYLPQGGGGIKVKEELNKPNSRLAYSQKTRNYLRRRAWRSLKRLGIAGDSRYVDMASRLLLEYTPQDCNTDKVPSGKGAWGNTYDGYASYLAFNAILHTNSVRYSKSLNGLSWMVDADCVDEGRTEAFSEIWDRHPEALFELLAFSPLDPVAQFAAKALKDNSGYCAQLSDDDLLKLLAAKTQIAVEFAVERLQSRTLNLKLLLALLQSGNEQAGAMAIAGLQQIGNPFTDGDFIVSLLLIDHPILQQWISQQALNLASGYAEQQALLNDLVMRISAEDASLSESQAEWLATLLMTSMESTIRDFASDKLLSLLIQADAGVQLFAVRLLEINRINFRDIPDSLLKQINQSDSAAMRAAGLLLFNKTSERELLQQLPLFTELIYHAEPAERQACLLLLTRLTALYGKDVFGQLFPLIFKEEIQPGQQQELIDFINQKLTVERDRLDKNTVWRLANAKAVAAQRLGAAILETRQSTDFSVKQWVVLASNPNQAIRTYVQRAFEQNVARVKNYGQDAIKLLESGWVDSREFGFTFFNQHYQQADWSTELIVSLCDSNLPDVQAYGREQLQTFFRREQGEEYLQKLSQHPSVQVQAFVTNLLDDYASGKPEIILSLRHYYLSVLSQINKGRVSKDRILAFLLKEANASQPVLEMVAELFSRLSLTLVHKDKSQLIKSMLILQKQHPSLSLPIATRSVRILSQVQGEHHAG